MKLITRDTDYAIKAICYIAKNQNRITSVRGLVKDLKMPRPFLRKILQILHKRKILNAFKGQGGGFLLAKTADKIFLVELMEIFQGPLKLNDCIFKKRICLDRSDCSLKQKIDHIERNVVSELKSITIASLL